MHGIDLVVRKNRILVVTGESGCRKSMTARAIMGIIPSPGMVTGQIYYNAAAGEPPINLTDLDPKGEAYREVRGNQISMIFQEPMSMLSPVQRSAIRSARSSCSIRGCRRRRRDLAVELLDRVGITDPNRRIDQ